MNIDQLGREAAAELVAHTRFDTAAGLRELRRLRTRRTVERAVAVVAALVVASAVVGLAAARGDHRSAQPIHRVHGVDNGIFVTVTETSLSGYGGGTDYLRSPPSDVEPISQLGFTADGRRLFYQNVEHQVVAFGVNDGVGQVVADCPRHGPCDFGVSPDGRSLAFHGSRGLVVRDLESGGTRTLPTAAGATLPQWSADGRHIAFIATKGIYVINTDGSGQHRVYALDGHRHVWSHVSWSPDGRAIAFMRADDVVDNAGKYVEANFALMTVQADGSAARTLRLAGTCFCAGIPAPCAAWSPDGRLIAFSTVDPGKQGVPGDSTSGGSYVVRPDGTGLRDVRPLVVGFTLAWQPKPR